MIEELESNKELVKKEIVTELVKEEVIDAANDIDAEKSGMRYDDANIDERIIRAIKEMGFEYMTPIQELAIPKLMENVDVIGQAQTGTGKTAAFGIPMLQRIDAEDRSLQGLILCPTRELAIQAAEELRKFSKYMHGIKMAPIYGGQDIVRQIKALKDGAQIIVGTPGRVMDHMRRHTVKFDKVKMVVLDEADEMLNMGFREDMETILTEIKHEHQTALFSATMPQAILDITDQYQTNPELLKVTKKELTISLIKQIYFVVKSIYKEEVISRLLELYGFKRSLIFCNTKRMVDELSENLKNRGYQAEGLHGDMTQKQRDFVMGRFKSGNLEILIATDVAARGIDVDDLEAVFNYDIPQDIEYYVHRIGRTGRAGREGMAFTFAYGRDLYRIREIEKICKTKMTEMKIPKADQIMDGKLDKALRQASEKAASMDLSELQEKLEEKITSMSLDPMELLTAMIKMQVGEKLQDIVVEESKTFGYGSRRRGEASEGRHNCEGRDSKRRGSYGEGRRHDDEKEGKKRFDKGYLGEKKYTRSKSEDGQKTEGRFKSDDNKKNYRRYKSEDNQKFTKKFKSDDVQKYANSKSSDDAVKKTHDKSFRERNEKVDVRRDGSRAYKRERSFKKTVE